MAARDELRDGQRQPGADLHAQLVIGQCLVHLDVVAQGLRGEDAQHQNLGQLLVGLGVLADHLELGELGPANTQRGPAEDPTVGRADQGSGERGVEQVVEVAGNDRSSIRVGQGHLRRRARGGDDRAGQINLIEGIVGGITDDALDVTISDVDSAGERNGVGGAHEYDPFMQCGT